MPFQFRHFFVDDRPCAMKVGTDGILLGAWFQADPNLNHVCDVGTGSGLISLMLAQRFPSWKITGIEIDSAAAGSAAVNFQQSPWSDRLRVVSVSWQEWGGNRDNHTAWDAIVCNPPYFAAGPLPPAGNRQDARHQTRLTPQSFFASCRRWGHEESVVGLIVPTGELNRWQQAAGQFQFSLQRQTNVSPLPGRPAKRSLLQFQGSPCPAPRIESLVLESTHHVRTAEFQALTRDFYLR